MCAPQGEGLFQLIVDDNLELPDAVAQWIFVEFLKQLPKRLPAVTGNDRRIDPRSRDKLIVDDQNTVDLPCDALLDDNRVAITSGRHECGCDVIR